MQQWIALDRDQKKNTWVPSTVFNKVYQRASHIKAAFRVIRIGSDTEWEIIREHENLLECELIHLCYNPVKRRRERYRSGTKVLFVEISTLIHRHLQRLPDGAEILRLPAAQNG